MRVVRSNHKLDLNIGKSFAASEVAKSPQALVGFHAFTGGDQTGKFNDYAKQSCWNSFITPSKKVIDAFLLCNNSNNILQKNTLMA